MVMLRDIRESDWKVLRGLKDVALGRFCQRVLDEMIGIAGDGGKTAHQRYLAVYTLLERRDRELAETFNGLRGSMALMQLARMVALGLLTEDEQSRFSVETRDWVKGLAEMREGHDRNAGSPAQGNGFDARESLE